MIKFIIITRCTESAQCIYDEYTAITPTSPCKNALVMCVREMKKKRGRKKIASRSYTHTRARRSHAIRERYTHAMYYTIGGA